MARRKRANKVPIIYKSGGTRIVYVSRAPEELFTEAIRIYGCVQMALRQLRLLKRTRHAAVKGTLWQLSQIGSPSPEASIADLVDYIAAVSYVMEDSLSLLAELKHSKIDELQAARFQLTYGQTPKKRDRDDTMCARRRRPIETEEDPNPDA